MQLFSLGQIANILDADLQGNSACEIKKIAPIKRAKAGDLTFFDNGKFVKILQTTKATAVLLPRQFQQFCPTNTLVVSNPKLALAKLLILLYPAKVEPPGLHSSVVYGQNCKISASVSVGANSTIGDNVCIGENTIIGAGVFIGDNVQIGVGCRIHSNVSIYHSVQIGNSAVIHSGVVLGADGFSFERSLDKWEKVSHIGSVLIGDEVEIGANTTIDRGMLDDTIIANGVKLDNLIMIAHNVEIGENTVIAGCTGIAGSAKIGRNCVIAGASAISDHVELVDNVIVSGMAMVTKSLMKPGIYSSGTGILSHKKWQKSVIRFKQLDEIHHKLKILEHKNEDKLRN